MALLCFDFQYPDLVRWMSGEYTDWDQNWYHEWTSLLNRRVRPLPLDYPIPKYELVYEAVTKGVPLAGKC